MAFSQQAFSRHLDIGCYLNRMVTRLRPVEFQQKAPTGKTEPAFLLCENSEGHEIAVLAKLSSKSERGLAGLAMEVLVACLAADLNLPVPEPFLLELDPDWIESIKPINAEWAAWAGAGSPLAFASRRLPEGYSTWIPGAALSSAAADLAAGALLLDAIMKNADRRPENPNCLKRGDSLVLIDHELCFPQFLLGVGDAWAIGGLQSLSTPGWHIFRDALQGKDVDWHAASNAWGALSDALLDGYAGFIPEEWEAAMPTIQGAIDRIKLARDNIADCTTEVQRVLKC